jgi:hypothetical protein
MEEFQRYIDQIMDSYNNKGILCFEGYSPVEMNHILYKTFEPGSPIALNVLTEADLAKSPILNLVSYLLDILKDAGEIKLTVKGCLPVKVVQDIYNQGFMPEYYISKGFIKLNREGNSLSVHLTRVLAQTAGLTKQRNGKLSLTNLGERLSANKKELFFQLFISFVYKLNWETFYRFDSRFCGQFGFGFSLILLAKYGSEERLDKFYSEKFFCAFPQLGSGLLNWEQHSFYSFGMFDLCLNYLGLVNIETRRMQIDMIKYITKTDLFDKLITIRPPRN